MRSPVLGQKGIAVGLFIVSVGLAGIGLAFVAAGQNMATLAEFAGTWPSVTGKILEAKEESGRPVLRYEYEAGGETYQGERVFLSDGPYRSVRETDQGVEITVMNPKSGQEESKEYRTGENIEVYHHPEERRQSVLHPYGLKRTWHFIVIGVVAVLAAMFVGARSFMYED